MPHFLNTPPLVEPLSLEEAKAHLRISHDDDDQYITRLIAAARRQIELRTSLAIITQGWTALCDRWPQSGTIGLPVAPVASVTDILLHGDENTSATLEPAHYILDAASRPARIVLRADRLHPQATRAINGIEIRFVAGFGATSDAVPQDIRQALLLTVASWFSDRGELNRAALPLMASALIQPFRQVRLA
jgi:uncharacterized phiE125 gp8 family phage protein